MFKLRVSNTLCRSSIAFLLSGPGIAVFKIGPLGSSGKRDWAPEEGAVFDAVAVAYWRIGRERGAIVRRRAAARWDAIFEAQLEGRFRLEFQGLGSCCVKELWQKWGKLLCSATVSCWSTYVVIVRGSGGDMGGQSYRILLNDKARHSIEQLNSGAS